MSASAPEFPPEVVEQFPILEQFGAFRRIDQRGAICGVGDWIAPTGGVGFEFFEVVCQGRDFGY